MMRLFLLLVTSLVVASYTQRLLNDTMKDTLDALDEMA